MTDPIADLLIEHAYDHDLAAIIRDHLATEKGPAMTCHDLDHLNPDTWPDRDELHAQVAGLRAGDTATVVVQMCGRPPALVTGELFVPGMGGLMAGANHVRFRDGDTGDHLRAVVHVEPCGATADDLDALGTWSVVLDKNGTPWVKRPSGLWTFSAYSRNASDLIDIHGPITVVNPAGGAQ